MCPRAPGLNRRGLPANSRARSRRLAAQLPGMEPFQHSIAPDYAAESLRIPQNNRPKSPACPPRGRAQLRNRRSTQARSPNRHALLRVTARRHQPNKIAPADQTRLPHRVGHCRRTRCSRRNYYHRSRAQMCDRVNRLRSKAQFHAVSHHPRCKSPRRPAPCRLAAGRLSKHRTCNPPPRRTGWSL